MKHVMFSASYDTPAIFTGEGEPRQGRETESDQAKIARNRYSIPIERLQREKELFAKLQSLRYSFAAVFGPASIQPFDAMREVQAKILTAASVLLEMAAFGQSVGNSDDGMTELRNTLGW